MAGAQGQTFFGLGGISVDLGNGQGGSITRDPTTGAFEVDISTSPTGSQTARNTASDIRTITSSLPGWLPIAILGIVVLLAVGGLAGRR